MKCEPRLVAKIAHLLWFFMLQNGIQGLSGSQTVCVALGALLNQLSGAGTISLSTSGPPSPDNSLLQHPEFFGNLVLVQRAAGELACIDPAIIIMKSHPYIDMTLINPCYVCVHCRFTDGDKSSDG